MFSFHINSPLLFLLLSDSLVWNCLFCPGHIVDMVECGQQAPQGSHTPTHTVTCCRHFNCGVITHTTAGKWESGKQQLQLMESIPLLFGLVLSPPPHPLSFSSVSLLASQVSKEKRTTTQDHPGVNKVLKWCCICACVRLFANQDSVILQTVASCKHWHTSSKNYFWSCWSPQSCHVISLSLNSTLQSPPD